MHKLEITGATPEDLFMNAIRMLSVLLKGGAVTVPAEPAKDALAGGVAGSVAHEAEAGSNPDGADQAPKTRAKRGTKNTEPKILNDDISDVGKTIEHEPQKLTLDGDIRPRLREIQKACQERGLDMKASVAYILKLYGPFGVQKADQLKEAQFAEFMEASEAYLKGEA
jgi:hypothetical protein